MVTVNTKYTWRMRLQKWLIIVITLILHQIHDFAKVLGDKDDESNVITVGLFNEWYKYFRRNFNEKIPEISLIIFRKVTDGRYTYSFS